MRFILFLIVMLHGAGALADCSDPPAPEGRLVYNAAYKVAQFCDGAHWISMAGGGSGADPRIGALTPGRWCTANGAGDGIVCNAAAPLIAAAGSAGQVQFHDGGGGLAADSRFAWDNTAKVLTLSGAFPLVLRGPAGAGGHVRLLTGTDTAQYWGIIKRGGDAAAAHSLLFSFYDGAGWNEALYMTPDRRVGVRTSTPLEALHVEGRIRANASGASGGVVLREASHLGQLYVDTSSSCEALGAVQVAIDDGLRLCFRRLE